MNGNGDSGNSDYMFNKMVSEAMEEVAHKGWKEADNNAVTLASFGMLNKAISNRMHTITRPFWWAAGAIGATAITYIMNVIIELR